MSDVTWTERPGLEDIRYDGARAVQDAVPMTI